MEEPDPIAIVLYLYVGNVGYKYVCIRETKEKRAAHTGF